jgi:hypothetical protein
LSTDRRVGQRRQRRELNDFALVEPNEQSRTIRRELWIVAAAVLALLLVPLLQPSIGPLLTRPLWLDELHTWLLSRDLPSLSLVRRLQAGADFNPPLLFLVDSLLLRVLPWLPAQVTLRLTSVVAVVGTVVWLYRIHRSRLGVLPSIAGALAPLAHSTLHAQLFEARFYAPWLLLTVAVAWALQGVVEHPRSRPRFALLVLLSAATCLIHYFGVISLACLALGVAVQQRAPARLWRPALGLALGAIALAAWLPVYAAQRRVLSVSTWVTVTTPETAYKYLETFLGYPAFAGVLALLGLVGLRRESRAERGEPSVAHAALLGLLALPIVLVVFSIVVQPSLVPRYALPAVAGGSCLVALAAARLPRPLPLLVVLMLLATHGIQMRRRARMAREFTRVVAMGVAAVNRVADDPRAVLSLDRGILYPTALSAANRNSRLAFVVIPTDSIRRYPGPMWNDTPEFNIVERDAAIAHHRAIGFPTLLPLEQLRAMPSFYFLVSPMHEESPFALLFRDRAVCRVQQGLLLYGAPRVDSAAPHARDIRACEETAVR